MAEIHASGRHSKSAGGVSITGTNFPPSTVTVLIAAGLDSPGSVNNLPHWDGTLCLTGFIGRLRIRVTDNSGGVDFGGATSWNQVGFNVGPAQNRNHAFQAWYRDGAAGLSGANFSSAVSAYIVQ